MFSAIKKWLDKIKPLNRIYFIDNPYPYGHKIDEFVWSGRLQKDKGLFFDFHLETVDYYAEDNSEPDYDQGSSDWDSKIVWSNYHSCTMSSTKWDGTGINVADKENQLNFNELLNKKLIVDRMSHFDEFSGKPLAFNMYLLGHDACANHEISFFKQHDAATFDIEWNGKIALTYAADFEFKYSFKSKIGEVTFSGIHLDKTLSQQANKELLAACVSNHEAFDLIDNTFQLKRQQN